MLNSWKARVLDCGLKKSDDVLQVLENLFSSPDMLTKMKENTKLLANVNSTKDICEILL